VHLYGANNQCAQCIIKISGLALKSLQVDIQHVMTVHDTRQNMMHVQIRKDVHTACVVGDRERMHYGTRAYF
jgi:hypothetical protein